MKKSKTKPVIVETSVGKFLLRDFRPPIQLRTSPRKKKNKIKKEIKRLTENSTTLLKSKTQKRKHRRKISKIKKQLSFDDVEEEQEKDSILFIISNDEQKNHLNDEELTNNKYK